MRVEKVKEKENDKFVFLNERTKKKIRKRQNFIGWSDM